jgi:hypothetical protein
MSTYQNRPTAKDRASKAILGIDKHLAGVASMTLDGVAYTPAELKSLLQGDIDSANATDTAKAAWQKAAQIGRAKHGNVMPLLLALRTYLVLNHGADAVDLLADFGFKPPKPRKVAVKVKAAAADKTAATRAARHTMGSQQKKAVKGAVPAATTPPATAAAPVTTAATTPAAPQGTTGGTPHT